MWLGGVVCFSVVGCTRSVSSVFLWTAGCCSWFTLATLACMSGVKKGRVRALRQQRHCWRCGSIDGWLYLRDCLFLWGFRCGAVCVCFMLALLLLFWSGTGSSDRRSPNWLGFTPLRHCFWIRLCFSSCVWRLDWDWVSAVDWWVS
jgi:hypothetical protein